MVAAVSSTPNSKVSPPPPKPKRPPESRDVISRYVSNPTTDKMTSSSSSSSSSTTSLSLNPICTPRRRLMSTNHVTPASPVNSKRDHSVERRRSGNPKTSARSLAVSFQGESFALPVIKPARNGTPERRKTVAPQSPARTSENSNLVDKQRWPGRSKFMTMSVDFTNEKLKFNGSGTAVCDPDNSDHAISDTDSISSGSTPVRRAIVVPARFWQETINLLRRVQPEPISPLMSSSKSKRLISRYKVSDDGPKQSAKRSPSSPVRGGIPPSSPPRNTVGSNGNLGNTLSILSFSVDSKRGKVGEKNLVDAHVLRLMHNKHLQWRFANAKADAAMLVQEATVKKSIYNAWITISKIWHSVLSKRAEMQQLKQNLKLHSILKKQMSHLDNWDLTDRDYSVSLAGTIGALESSSLCLPVLSGAKADIQNLKDAICSAFDVMQAITVSICSSVTKVEHVNSMASELASTTKGEYSLLDQCKDLLTTLTLMELQDCSLRTHTLQLMPTTSL